MLKKISIRSPNTLGCTLISTILLQSLRMKFKDYKLNVYTKFPDLLKGLKEVDKVIDLKDKKLIKYDIDLSDYLIIKRPQENQPLRHLADHIFEVAQLQMKEKLPGKLGRNFSIKINLTKKELSEAKSIAKKLSNGKKLVWLQIKTRERKKDWKDKYWNELIEKGREKYAFVDLSSRKYKRRISIAITKYCFAGVTLDSFMLHGSHAVGAKNVIVLLFSSHKQVVTYPEQTIF